MTVLRVYDVHLSLDYEEQHGYGGTTLQAVNLDAAVARARDEYGDDVVVVSGEDGTREFL